MLILSNGSIINWMSGLKGFGNGIVLVYLEHGIPGDNYSACEDELLMDLKVKVAITVLTFSVIGYILGCFVHSEFYHHFFNWLFGG